MRSATVALLALLSSSCGRAAPPAPVPPLTTGTPAASAPAPAAPSSADAGIAPHTEGARPPVEASFVDLPAKVEGGPCVHILVAAVKGKGIARGVTLAPGDVLALSHAETLEITGSGVAAVVRSDSPCAVRDRPAEERVVVRASKAPELTWAKGTMHAHLDVEKDVSPDVYLGRLSGTAAVAEHTHDGSWEILLAIDAAGTFTLDGVPKRLGARQVVLVPPGTKHAWTPDPGSTLTAVQLYAPPGPEQRFRKLAAGGK